MGEGDIDFYPNGGDIDWSKLDDILEDDRLACTHAHICDPPGPDLPHTHTCVHFHTKTVPVPADEKRPRSNREAVRKYREKKKARAASLEDEVVQLRALNQQLMKRLQIQPALEAEIARLRCLVVDIRGRIEGEIGRFPYQKPCDFSNPCGCGQGSGDDAEKM